jgi:serine/threonine protein kinase
MHLMNRCPACGTTYPDDARFCTRDGSRLLTPGGEAAMTPPLGSATIPDAPPVAPDAPVRRTTPPTRGEGSTPLTHFNLTGKTLQGRYQVEKKVGEGGMSFVYLATDIATRERYAIKVLSAALSQDANAMARLRREASLGMRLAHPNVCHIIRLGETEDGLVYVVMPFVEGEILADRTNRRGHIPLDETARLLHDMASGLNVAHDLKIVHRDLKPENIMVSTRPDGTDYAVVMDFGLAKERKAGAELQKLTATGIILGTPEFMSPEQLRGKPLDARTDIYSLALMTYEMLTGKLPFQGRTQQEMMIARLRSDPTPLRKMRPELNFPEAVERVLAKAMARNPDERYQTTCEFSDAFTAAAAARATPPASNTLPADGGLLGKLFGR